MMHSGQTITLPDGMELDIGYMTYERSVGEDLTANITGYVHASRATPTNGRCAPKSNEPADKSKAPIKPKRVLYYNKATITYWTDGTKTVVKCDPRDKYSKRMGLFLCHLKKLCGNNSRAFNDMFKRMQEIIANKEYEGEKE